MIKNLKKCDICGRETDMDFPLENWTKSNLRPAYVDQDICPDCFEKYNKAMEEITKIRNNASGLIQKIHDNLWKSY